MAYCGPRGIALSDFLRWDPDDQDAALEWSSHEARRCPNCRTHPDEWVGNPHARHAHLSDPCPGCEKQGSLVKRATNDGKHPLKDGVTVLLPEGPPRECRRCNPPAPPAA